MKSKRSITDSRQIITIGIDPILFSNVHFHLRWYSLIVITAVMIGIWLAAREAARKGFKKEDIYDASIWVMLGGIIGVHLFHVIDHWPDEYAANSIRGLYIWGAVAAGLTVVAILVSLRGWRLPM